eukprot:TRINITY_DN6588_c0_g1_i2.p1 TRINITY_DN6588_c0_g1~~TRINITY_DN6588_c0_g1_i2.p1  ORF type:complete len:386 (+),score=65.76 TRINITY_DN6588_c0_g1_i2:114-1271(+)
MAGLRVVLAAVLCGVVDGNCALGCSGHGACDAGACACESGWIGTRCGMSQLTCNWELCLGRGVCIQDQVAFRCSCEPQCGWIGAACSVCGMSDGVCVSPCPQVPTNVRFTSEPAKAGDADSAQEWWLPLVILVPVLFVLVVSAYLVKSALALRAEKVQEFEEDEEGGQRRVKQRGGRGKKKGGKETSAHSAPSAPPEEALEHKRPRISSQQWRESYASFKTGPDRHIATALDLPSAAAPPGYPSPPPPPELDLNLAQPQSPHTPPSAPPIAASFAAVLREESQRAATAEALDGSFHIEIDDGPPALIQPGSRENSQEGVVPPPAPPLPPPPSAAAEGFAPAPATKKKVVKKVKKKKGPAQKMSPRNVPNGSSTALTKDMSRDTAG